MGPRRRLLKRLILLSIMVLTGSCALRRNVQVAVQSPTADGSVGSPVQFTATAISAYPITKFVVYANKQNVYQTNGSNLKAGITLSPGTYKIFIRAWDSSGAYGTSPSFWISVVQSATSAVQVTVQSPAAGATLSS